MLRRASAPPSTTGGSPRARPVLRRGATWRERLATRSPAAWFRVGYGPGAVAGALALVGGAHELERASAYATSGVTALAEVVGVGTEHQRSVVDDSDGSRRSRRRHNVKKVSYFLQPVRVGGSEGTLEFAFRQEPGTMVRVLHVPGRDLVCRPGDQPTRLPPALVGVAGLVALIWGAEGLWSDRRRRRAATRPDAVPPGAGASG